MTKITPVIVVKGNGTRGRKHLCLHSVNDFNPIRNTITQLRSVFPDQRLFLYTDVKGIETDLIDIGIDSTRITIKYRSIEADTEPSILISRGLTLLANGGDFGAADQILMIDPLLLVPHVAWFDRIKEYAKGANTSRIAIKPVFHHPCLMYSMRDPSILDPYHPLPCNIPVTYDGIYHYDFDSSRMIDSKTGKQLNGRQQYFPFYQSLKGLALFQYGNLSDFMRKRESGTLHGIELEDGFYIESTIDLIKAAYIVKNNGRSAWCRSPR